MDNFNNLEQAFSEEEERLKKRLLSQLNTGEKTSNLTSAPEWEFYENSLVKTIEQNKTVLASDKFINDHNGYLFLAAQTLTLQRLIDNIGRIKSAYVSAANKLNELEDSNDE